jgi:hypothetical protein
VEVEGHVKRFESFHDAKAASSLSGIGVGLQRGRLAV